MLNFLKKIEDFFDNNKKAVWAGLFLIVVLSIFLRTTNYHDWLYFKWDQARDATLLSEAIENGPQHLPLLGPRATKVGDEYLRLGPAYYYFQYFSGVLFGSTEPDVFAYVDLFFSILIIPLFYIFLRLHFSPFHSLLATAFYAFSFLIILHSRFSWNPNSVPFFLLLSFYCLFRFMRSLKEKTKLWYFAGMVFSALIASQLHFFAFFTILAIFGLYFLLENELWKISELKNIFWKIFSKFGLKLFAIFIFLFSFIYSPVIISDIATSGNNAKNFAGAFSEKPKDKKLSEKIIRNFREHGRYYSLLMISFSNRDGKKNDPITVWSSWIFLISSMVLIVGKIKKSENKNEKAFLKFLIVWAVAFFVVSIPMAYQLRPRFFVVVFPLPWIFLALWFPFLKEKFGKKSLPIIFLAAFFFLATNAYGTRAWFIEQKLSQEKQVPVGRTYILKKDDGITLRQLEKAVDFMYDKRRGNVIYYYTKPEYELSIAYLLDLKYGEKIDWKFIKKSQDMKDANLVFALNTTKGGWNSVSKKIKDYASLDEEKTKQFGQLSVFVVNVDEEKISKLVEDKKNENEKYIEKEISNQADEESDAEDNLEEDEFEEEIAENDRLFWRDIFGKNEGDAKMKLGPKE